MENTHLETQTQETQKEQWIPENQKTFFRTVEKCISETAELYLKNLGFPLFKNHSFNPVITIDEQYLSYFSKSQKETVQLYARSISICKYKESDLSSDTWDPKAAHIKNLMYLLIHETQSQQSDYSGTSSLSQKASVSPTMH